MGGGQDMNEALLCSALTCEYGNHQAGASSKQHVAMLTSMLQFFKHPGKKDYSCFFSHKNMKQLENIFEISRAIS